MTGRQPYDCCDCGKKDILDVWWEVYGGEVALSRGCKPICSDCKVRLGKAIFDGVTEGFRKLWRQAKP